MPTYSNKYYLRVFLLSGLLMLLGGCGGGGSNNSDGSSSDDSSSDGNSSDGNSSDGNSSDGNSSDGNSSDGNSSDDSSSDGSSSGVSSWVAGVYKPATNFKGRCVVPRHDVDSSGQRLYADTQGSLLDELNWLRSWSNETYLWYDEVEDQNPALFDDPLTYFDTLKTNATTVSGHLKDPYHFFLPTEEFLRLTQNAEAVSYGAHFVLTRRFPPRELVVAYVDSNSSAVLAGLQRGDKVVGIDGIDIVNTTHSLDIYSINRALTPQGKGDSHIFEVNDGATGQLNEVTLTANVVTTKPVHTVNLLNTNNGQVGYVLFNSHVAPAEQALLHAIQQFQSANISDLVVDLRYNSGGQTLLASQLAYMVAGDRANGKVFANFRYNDKWVTRDFNGRLIQPLPFINTGLGFSAVEGTPLPALGLSRVFILTGAETCSASEAIINGLQGIDVEVVLVGDQTCGKPYGSYPADNCGTTYSTLQLTVENAKGFGEYVDGFVPAHGAAISSSVLPGCLVADDFSQALGSVNESRLATALAYRETGRCPASKLNAPVVRVAVDADLPEVSVDKPWWSQGMMLP